MLTREQFIREALRDYEQGHTVTEEKLGIRREQLCNKFQICNSELDSYKRYFRTGYCVLCQTNGHGVEKKRTNHFKLWHDLGIRGLEYRSRVREENDEEALWEKKLKEAVVLRKELQKEETFIQQNSERIS